MKPGCISSAKWPTNVLQGKLKIMLSNFNFEYFFLLCTNKMSDPYVTTGGTEFHQPKVYRLKGKTAAGNPSERWQIQGLVDGKNKPTWISKATGEEYKAAGFKIIAGTMKTPKARKSCKDKAAEVEEKCEAKKAAKKKSPKKKAPKKKSPSPAAASDEEDEESSGVVESSEEERAPTPKPKTPKPKKKAPKKKAPAKRKPAKK